MSWTDERIDRLKELWTQGMTASQIADELGGGRRNAVIGKAHRLGLQSRPSPVKPNEPAPASRRRAESRQRPRREPKPTPRAAEPEPRSRAERRAATPAGAAAAAPRPRQRRRSRRSARSARAASSARARATSSRRSRRRRRAGWCRPSRARRSPTRPACSISTRRSANGRSAIPASPISISADARPIPASLIASSIAGSPIRRSCRAATAGRRRRCRSAGRASAKAAAPPRTASRFGCGSTHSLRDRAQPQRLQQGKSDHGLEVDGRHGRGAGRGLLQPGPRAGRQRSEAAAPAAAAAPIQTRYKETISGQPLAPPPNPFELLVTEVKYPTPHVIACHKHSWPRYVYVQAGRLRVTNHDTRQVKEFKAGQVVVEAIGQWHHGDVLEAVTLGRARPGAARHGQFDALARAAAAAVDLSAAEAVAAGRRHALTGARHQFRRRDQGAPAVGRASRTMLKGPSVARLTRPKPAAVQHLRQLRLAGLGAERLADFLRQRGRDADHRRRIVVEPAHRVARCCRPDRRPRWARRSSRRRPPSAGSGRAGRSRADRPCRGGSRTW